MPPPPPEAARFYVLARAAESNGDVRGASASYAQALQRSPGSQTVASNALGHALVAGDRALAIRAAAMLDRAGDTSPEVQFVLLDEALRTRNWRDARLRIDHISKSELFAFTAPILRAWLAVDAGGDPLAELAAAEQDQMGQTYAPEVRAFVQLAKERRGARELVAAAADAAGSRRDRLRIAAAAFLARRGDRREALEMLQGDSDAIAAARSMVQARQRIPGEIGNARTGIAEFLTRFAIDLNAHEVRQLATAFARISSFMAPDNSEAAVVLASLLAAENRHDAAIAAVAGVAANDPFAPAARDMRVRLLLAGGRRDEALAEARALAAAPGANVYDWTRSGDVLVEMGRHGEAAQAYARAIQLAQAANITGNVWQLHLLHGGALERAGDWPAGKAALERAYALAPSEPLVLNYLGYGQLSRRENIEAATAMVAEAHRLAPDNAAITDSLGWAYYMNGDIPRAIELIERAAQAEPADVEINEHLGDAYYRAGRRMAARYAWQAALVAATGADAERLRTKIASGLPPQLATR